MVDGGERLYFLATGNWQLATGNYYNGGMRNTGWYIPYWRKQRKKGKPDKPQKSDKTEQREVSRGDDQLEGVRQRWVERYRRTARALRMLGLSVGSNKAEVQARYESLRAADGVPSREVEDAYRYLTRVLPAVERRKRRPPPSRAATVRTETELVAATDDATGASYYASEEQTEVIVVANADEEDEIDGEFDADEEGEADESDDAEDDGSDGLGEDE